MTSFYKTKKSYRLILILFISVSLIVLFDFVLPGKIFIEKIIDAKSELQRHYNASGNYHFSYRIFTGKHNFSVTESFAKTTKVNQQIEYSVSPIFKEINSCRIVSSENKEIYYLRIFSGFVIPLLAIITLLIAYWHKQKLEILIFVTQVLLLVDLIFLMM